MAELQITVVTSAKAGQTQEWALQLAPGATVQDALKACGLNAADAVYAASIWGKSAAVQRRLHDQDRVEWCRALKVDPKVARRERFASQGSRGAGLFSKRRDGAKSGY
ncbi:RnfH family protein [Diaphorobacter sp. HDW4A]|uniref:RnfH family protein n=1 Tax=Diaphorobacter sp. HDW4A TaxID=2714924 RepID=UPI00140D9B28|nr:RnfH family protein [Diaphorobacter sp. HDW4A]QIL79608.1 RnfH family protein [Diaphorobacter sp. HDW4A]